MITISFMDLLRITSAAKVLLKKYEEKELVQKTDEIRDWAARQDYESLENEEIMIDIKPF